MRSAAYWEKRSLDREQYARNLADEALRKKVFNAYTRAEQQIVADAKKIFDRYASTGGLTEAEAKQLLSTRESADILRTLRAELSAIADPDVRRKALNRLHAQAYGARIGRVDALRERIRAEMAKVADAQTRAIDDTLRKVIPDTYYRSIYDMQVGTGYAFDFSVLPERVIQGLVRRPYMGTHFSARVWADTQQVADTIYGILSKGLTSGMSVARMTRELMDATGGSRYAAARLIRTEANHAYNAAELEVDKAEGVERYRYIATLDSRTCDVCGRLDGKTFPVDEAETGVNFPPMHPNDRCTTAPDVDAKLLKNLKRRARDPVTGEEKLVPADTTWEQWRDGGVENNLTIKMGEGTIDPDGDNVVSGIVKMNSKYSEIVVPGATIQDAERVIFSLGHEVGVLCDKSGIVTARFEGTKHAVSAHPENEGDWVGKIFTHNHPGGRTFTTQDIVSFANARLYEVRVCTPKGTYYSLKQQSEEAHSGIGKTMQAEKVGTAPQAIQLLRERIEQDIYPKDYANTHPDWLYDLQGELVDRWLEANAEGFGFIYEKGVL